MKDFYDTHKQKIVSGGLIAVAVIAGLLALLLVNRLTVAHKHNVVMRENMTLTMDGFISAMKEGDMTKARSFCEDSAAAALGLSMLDADTYRQEVLAGLAMEEETLSDEIRASVDSFTSAQKSRVLTNCEYEPKTIKMEKTEGGTKGTVTATLTGLPSLYAIDFSGDIQSSNDALGAYVTENSAALTDSYEAEGEAALRNVLKTKEVTELLSTMKKKVEKAETVTRNFAFTFTLTSDEDGKISDCVISSVKPVEEEKK